MSDASLRLTFLLVVSLMLVNMTALPASATYSFGGTARAVAMGGAGLASGDVDMGAAAINPAALADTHFRLGIDMPSLSATIGGIGQDSSQAQNLIGSAILDPDKVINLALQMGREPTQIDASVSGGVLLPQMDIRGQVAIRAQVLPNADFQTWANGGGLINGIPSTARSDVYAVGFANVPNVAIGGRLPSTEGRMRVGVRIKPTRAYYSHYIVDANAINTQTPELAPEMRDATGAPVQYLQKDSVAADIGFLFTPNSAKDLQLAAVVDNVIEPQKVTFNVAPTTLIDTQVSPRMISVGAALVEQHLTLATDVFDLGRAYGDPQIRAGAELRPGSNLALRGGYNKENGFTYGVGVGNVSIAYSKNIPVILSDAVKF